MAENTEPQKVVKHMEEKTRDFIGTVRTLTANFRRVDEYAKEAIKEVRQERNDSGVVGITEGTV